MIAQSIDVVLFVDDLPVGGQLNATLNRSVASIDITNKIDGEWAEHIGGVKTWNIPCSGLYVLNESALNKLEEAFLLLFTVFDVFVNSVLLFEFVTSVLSFVSCLISMELDMTLL